MHNDLIITISREYGCGARHVGERLAKKLGIPYYDAHIIEMAAELSGLAPDFIKRTEQRQTGGLFFSGGAGSIISGGTSLADQVYLAQFTAIREIAEKGSCVIVGRCADAILRDDYRILRVFLHADFDQRVKRAIEVYGVEPDKAEKMVKDTDRARTRHYKHYSDLKWGVADNYDICMDMGTFTFDGAVQILADCINVMNK